MSQCQFTAVIIYTFILIIKLDNKRKLFNNLPASTNEKEDNNHNRKNSTRSRMTVTVTTKRNCACGVNFNHRLKRS